MTTNFKLGIMSLNRITDARDEGGRKYKYRPTNYIDQTVSNLIEKAGFKKVNPSAPNWEFRIFDSGSADLSYLDKIKNKYPYIKIEESHNGRLTLNENANRLLKWACTDSKWAVLMQDDIDIAKDSCLKIIKWVNEAPEDADLLTLWNPMLTHKEKYIEVPPQSFWSSVFLIFKSSSAEDYLNWPLQRKKGTGHDMSIKNWAESEQKNIYANSDGLIDHIGKYSSLGSREKRHHPKFKG